MSQEGPTVNIDRGVLIERPKDAARPYFGGYRKKMTGDLYFHACTQTEGAVSKDSSAERVESGSQTVDLISRSAQTCREAGTQMLRRDLHVDSRGDRVIIPGRYFTSHQLAELKLRKTIVIQCYWRGYRARCRASLLRQERYDRITMLQDLEERATMREEVEHNNEVQRRMNPRTKQDFEVLYNELDKWREKEILRVNSSHADKPEEERVKALAQLLHKETKLLQTIDRLRLAASKQNNESRIQRMLGLMAAPKRVEMKTGDVVEVATPYTNRARELMELFNGLKLPLLTVDERLDVLLNVKWTVKEFDCNLTREIVELIDREADLLNRGRSERSLEGLRKRISTLFLQFVETPEFNPEASRFEKIAGSRVPEELVNKVRRTDEEKFEEE